MISCNITEVHKDRPTQVRVSLNLLLALVLQSPEGAVTLVEGGDKSAVGSFPAEVGCRVWPFGPF